jgi:AAA domain-containing protein
MSGEDRTDGRQGFLHVVQADPTAQFLLRPGHIPDATKVPPRQWIYGTHLIRGFVSLLVAPGGTGKSSYIIALCIAIALGRPLFGVPIRQRCNTALANLEDPQDEIDRRLAGIGKFYNVNDEDLDGRFFMTPAEQRLVIAAEADSGFEVVHPDEAQIINRIRENNIGVLAVDPFAESHQLEENSNPHMIRAAAAWRRVARAGNCAVLLAHHVRKGQVDSIEAARGAKALTDSARVGLLLSAMTDQEADALSIERDDRLSYVRLDDAKANLAPRAAKAAWFHLATVKLGNGGDGNPDGDSVGVIERWTPESPWERLSTMDCNRVLDAIEVGLPDGQLYSSSRQTGPRWAGNVLMELFDMKEAAAAEVITKWVGTGVLRREKYHDPQLRKERMGLRVNNTNRPGTQFDT